MSRVCFCILALKTRCFENCRAIRISFFLINGSIKLFSGKLKKIFSATVSKLLLSFLQYSLFFNLYHGEKIENNFLFEKIILIQMFKIENTSELTFFFPVFNCFGMMWQPRAVISSHNLIFWQILKPRGFESMWLETNESLKDKCIVNISVDRIKFWQIL